MAVYYVLGPARVTYSVVVHVKSEKEETERKRERKIESRCVYTNARLSVCECMRARDARCTSAEGISSSSHSRSLSLSLTACVRTCAKAHFARERSSNQLESKTPADLESRETRKNDPPRSYGEGIARESRGPGIGGRAREKFRAATLRISVSVMNVFGTLLHNALRNCTPHSYGA